MNQLHRCICRSSRWKRKLEEEILPWALSGGVELGRDVLEIGPGPGLTTDLLRSRFDRLTAVEVDRRLADSLARRMRGTNVRVIHGDATALPFENSSFSGAVSLTMLHHVPSPALQDKLFSEVCRVLRPGGALAGVDSVWSWRMEILHLWDTLVAIDPATLGSRLEGAGFTQTSVQVEGARLRFSAKRAFGPRLTEVKNGA